MYKSFAFKNTIAPIKSVTIASISALLIFSVSACGETEDLDSNNSTLSDTIQQVDQALAGDAEMNLGGLPQVAIPDNYEILSEVIGDLDGDGIDEKAIAFNTAREGEMGFERELRIYSEHEGLWSLWLTAIGPILSSESGGTMGDPFEKLEIRKGQLEIFHFGGSADKWSYSHAFEHVDGNWQLAGATLSFYRICDYTETYTYDLNNGTGYHSRHTESCNENGEKIESTIQVEEVLNLDKKKPAPLLESFVPGGTKVNLLNSVEPYFY